MPIDPTPGVPTPGDGLPRPHPRPHPRPSKGGGADKAPPQKPRAANREPSELDRVVRDKVKALPGSLTYLDLIRKNKRDSVLLIVAMFVLNALVGAAIGGAVIPLFAGFESAGSTMVSYADTLSQDPMNADFDGMAADAMQAPSRILGVDAGVFRNTGRVTLYALIGVAIMTLITLALALEAWFGGGRFLLNRVHAKEITKELDPELFNVVDEMRIAAGIPMPRVYLIPESALNAFATGRDPEHGIVAITTGLRAKLTRDELQGVMAHEIAHIRHYDIRFSMLMAMMVGLIVLACDALLRFAWYGGWASSGRRSGGDKKGGGAIVIIFMILALILAVVAPFLAKVIQMTYSRRREYLADAGAAELTRNPEGLASALKKLAEDKEPLVETANRGMAHMFIMNPLRKKKSRHEQSSLFSSHPPVADRIAKLIALTR
ncbi:MAG: M48 family metallopeptidase [Planctomycetota bacterium]